MNIPETLYQNVLPQLRKIEKIRKPYLLSKKIGSMSFAVLMLIIIGGITTGILAATKIIPDTLVQELGKYAYYFATIALPTGGSLWTISAISLLYFRAPLRKAEKTILKTTLKNINKNLDFYEKTIDQETILKSGFFTKKAKNSTIIAASTGIIEGKIENIEVTFAHINIIKNESGSSPIFFIPIIGTIAIAITHLILSLKNSFGKSENYSSFGFKGLFFTADFNKKLNGFTIVLPDAYEKKFGFLAKTIQELKKNKGELVYLEDPRFEKEFMVYSTDQIEARYILSTNFMEKILAFKKISQHPLSISFNKNKISIAIANPNGILEIPLDKNVINTETLEKLCTDINTCIGIIEDWKTNKNTL